MNTIINATRVNIDTYPEPDKSHPADSKNQLTIGDLHGNALKLIYFLVRQNVIRLEEKTYPELVRIYKLGTQHITQADLDSFNKILASITALPVGTVRLIGDELCDRGNNDYFTLKVLERLSQLKVPVETLLSNHGIEFIDQYESQDDFIAARLEDDHANSMLSLQALITKGLVSRDEINTIFHLHIKPSLRALSYTLDLEKNKITIYSHAGIDLSVIATLAKKLDVTYCDDSAKHLAQTIDFINEKIAIHIRNNTLHTLHSHEALVEGYHGDAPLNIETNPLEFIMWNRFYSQLKRPITHQKYYFLDFVHGHDPYDARSKNIYNLDNKLGKGQNHHQEDYNILYSQELPSYKCALTSKKLEREYKEDNAAEPKPETIKANQSKSKTTKPSPYSALFAKLETARLLTPDNRKIIEKIRNVYDLNEAIEYLAENKALNPDNLACLIQVEDVFFDTVAQALVRLEKANLCNIQMRDLITRYPRLSEKITSAMIELINTDIATAENINAIEQLLQDSYDSAYYRCPHQLALLLGELNKFGVLTHETRKLAILNVKHLDGVKAKLLEAKEQNNITPALCQKVFIMVKAEQSLKELHSDLDKANMLTPAMISTLEAKAQYADDLSFALYKLNSTKLLTPENWSLMLENDKHSRSLSYALAELEEAKLQEFTSDIIKHPEHSYDLACCLKNLKKYKLFTKSTFQLLMNYPEHSANLVDAFYQLKADGIYTDETREILLHNAQTGVKGNFIYYMLPHMLCQLDKAKFLNPICLANLRRLSANQLYKLFHVIEVMSSLRLLTEKNFLAITTALYMKRINCADFYDLLTQLKKTGSISSAKLKRTQDIFDKLMECSPFISELKNIKSLTMEILDKIINEKRVTKTTSLGMFSYPATTKNVECPIRTSPLSP
ncbi:MAG: Dot/Icm T4SS effector Wip [Gammaproteobacteria bacterium]